ncbi:MAG: SpoIIE family protein phosphatase [Candidatus Sericytochromatia bacterium]|nr:SpoIIE family protein phosphatase [Candidatus Sericytochromatia bacterium]
MPEATRLTRLVAAEQPLLGLTLVAEGVGAEGPRLLVGSEDAGPWAPLAALAAAPPPGAEGGLMAWGREPERLTLHMVRAVGPVARPTPRPARPAPRGRTHVVVSGDTLYRIARQHYGRPGMHAAIREANRDRLGPGRGLVAGMVLVLPEPVPGASVRPPAQRPQAPRRRLALRVEVPLAPEASPARRRALPLVVGLAAAAGAGAWWAVGVGWLRRRRRRALTAAREAAAGEVSTHLFPHPPAWDPAAAASPWLVEVAWQRWVAPGPARGLVDWSQLGPSSLGLWVGTCASPAMADLLACGEGRLLWRTLADEGQPPGRTVGAIEARLRAEGRALGRACFVRLALQTGEASYAALGFPGLYVLGRGGTLTCLSGPTAAAPDVLVQGRYTLAEGESLLLVPDDVLALEGPGGEPFGLDRLQRCLRARPGCPASEVVAALGRALAAFTGDEAHEVDAGALCVRLAARFGAGHRG